jgi:hypothetical protein
MRHVLLHYHVLKNAGSTVEYILDRSFGDKWTRFDGSDRNSVLNAGNLFSFLEENPNLLALSSHQLRYPKPFRGGYVFFDMFFVRDPIDRIYSMYKFFKRIPSSNDPLSDLAKAHEMGGFVAGMLEEFPHYINDMQVNCLANGGTYTRPPGENDLQAATAVLSDAAAPGVVDCFDESWIAAQYFLRPVFPSIDCRYVPHNTSSEYNTSLEERIQRVRGACGDKLYKQLLALNLLDMQLVDRVRAEVARRFNLVPDHEQRLEQLQNELRMLSAEADVEHHQEDLLVQTAGTL